MADLPEVKDVKIKRHKERKQKRTAEDPQREKAGEKGEEKQVAPFSPYSRWNGFRKGPFKAQRPNQLSRPIVYEVQHAEGNLMTNRVYIAVSLDGFIAAQDGGLDWLNDIPNPEQSDYGFFDFMNEIDAVVMGRKTFEAVVEMGEWIYTKPVFVWSNTLTRIPGDLSNNVKIVRGEVGDVVATLQAMNFQNLYVDGGRTIQSFLEADLIDEMIITTVSAILGAGIPLFGSMGIVRKFKLDKVEMLNDHMVKQYYSRCMASASG